MMYGINSGITTFHKWQMQKFGRRSSSYEQEVIRLLNENSELLHRMIAILENNNASLVRLEDNARKISINTS